MPSSTSAPTAEQNNAETPRITQFSDIGGITISFRTMPKDLEFAIARSKGVILAPEKNIPQAPIPGIGAVQLSPEPIPNLSPSHLETKSEQFLSKLAHPDNETEKKLEEIKIKKEKEAEEKEKNLKIKNFYIEAKSLIKSGLYQEATIKLEELLQLKPNHWRAKWALKSVLKKGAGQKKVYAQIKEEAEKSKYQLTEQLKAEEIKEKQTEEKFKAESILAQQKEAELQQVRQEKLAIEQQMKEVQNNILKIREEAEEKAKNRLEEQLQKEKQEAQAEHEARIAAEKQLAASEQEKISLEEKLSQEKELFQAKQKEAQLAAQQETENTLLKEKKKQEEMMEAERKRIEEEAKARQEYIQAQARIQYQPAQNIIPQNFLPAVETPSETTPAAASSIKSLLARLYELKPIKITTAVIIFLALISGIIYFVGVWKTNQLNNSQPSPGQTQTAIIPPSPLFNVDSTEKITLQAGQKKNLFNELKKLSEKEQQPGKFNRIIIEVVSQNQEKKLMDLPDLIDSLGSIFPSEILSSLGNDYTLFLYSQKETPSDPFLSGLGKNKLGLVVSISQKDKLNQQFSSWEKTMPDDLDAFFLGKRISFLNTYQFISASYQNIIIRSIDLPNQFSSLNYSFLSNKALITTSSESMRALIDRITPTQ